MKTIVYITALSIFILSCKAPVPVVEATTDTFSDVKALTDQTEVVVQKPESNDSLVAYIERTACYGTCPIYKFSIYKSGYAVYEGKRFVEKVGKFDTWLSIPLLAEIRTKAKNINYFDLNDEYPKRASDFPSTKTAVAMDGKRKDINNGAGGPTELKDFELYLDTIKDAAHWKELK